ncbi:TPA: DUF4282 domain-containing protein [Citrobacter freundii]
MLKFDSLLTPKLLKGLYALVTLVCVFMVLYTFDTRPYQAIAWLVAAIVARVPFELMMVSFKNNEYLRRICELMESNNSNFKADAHTDADFKE